MHSYCFPSNLRARSKAVTARFTFYDKHSGQRKGASLACLRRSCWRRTQQLCHRSVLCHLLPDPEGAWGIHPPKLLCWTAFVASSRAHCLHNPLCWLLANLSPKCEGPMFSFFLFLPPLIFAFLKSEPFCCFCWWTTI